MPNIFSKDVVIIYEPNHILKKGLAVWGEMITELLCSSGLLWRLVIRDISARYKQSFLGVFWAFFTPLVMTVAFVWVKERGVLPIDDTTMPYVSFVFFGQVVWLVFAHGVTVTAQSLVAAGSMLTKINFPKKILVISASGQTVFEFILRVPLLGIIFWWTGYLPDANVALVPLVLAPLLIFVVGIGFIVALLNAVFRDMSGMLVILINIGMFATPVIYPPPDSGPLAFWINFANPVSNYLIAARDLATVGYMSQPDGYLYAVIISLLTFAAGWRLIHLIEPKIAERV